MEELLDFFEPNQRERIKIYNHKGYVIDQSLIENTYVGTGYVVKLYDENGKVIDQVTIAIRGDLNSDGIIDVNDLSIAARYFTGSLGRYTNEYFYALDINRDGKLTKALDHQLLSNHLQGKVDIEEEIRS